jgi:arylsulfatase A-like enzyme
MSRLAGETILAQPADQPLYLQLHYLPPHQPYDPGPEFDRFTDPGYSGVIRPYMSLKPYSLGLESLEDEDLQHLIGLYDGNLSVADAAVGQVLAALKSAGRFDNTLIAITSDHGEAFMEHGRQGHNTTLFDEMLHVPLLLRLPGGKRPEPVDLNRLASVLDIVPTVLGYVGATPQPEVGGLDLLHTRSDPLRPRVLFFRTSHPKNTILAARTPSWKAISWPHHQVQMLFDLVEDPQERENLVGEQPYVYSGLGLRIRQHLQERSGLRWHGEEVEMTEEAAEALRALGYLN